MGLPIHNVGIDANDLAAMAEFWMALTGYRTSSASHDEMLLKPEGADRPGIFLQRVPEPRTGKNRLHIDLMADDLEAAVAGAEQLGAQRLRRHEEPDEMWQVLADPEGNEFCIVASGPPKEGRSSVGA